LVFIGKAFKAILAIGLSYHLFGLYIVMRHISEKYRYYTKQSLILNFTVFIPGIICYTYPFTDLYQKTHNFDLTPAMNLICMFLHILFMKYRFLNVFPIPFPKMMNKFAESILFIDSEGNISYYNHSFSENFKSCNAIKLDQRAGLFIEYLDKQTRMSPDKSKIIKALESINIEEVSGELVMDSIGKHFSVNIQPLFDRKDLIGRIVTFYDVTDYGNLLSEVNYKNSELALANLQLKEYASTVDELAVTRERNRLAGEIHDSVGHTMTILISLLGVCSLALDKKDYETVKIKHNEMMKVAIDGHRELKNSVQGIIPCHQKVKTIKQDILSLVDDFETTGVKVNISIDGQEPNHASTYGRIIRKICREALTNSLRHGKASTVEILLSFSNENISLYIFDDGVGCKEIKKNVGLHVMEERVFELGGNIRFGSDGEHGFNIHVDLPVQASK
jgi:signal transduction histidine kinase